MGAKLIPKDRILSGEALAELPQDKPAELLHHHGTHESSKRIETLSFDLHYNG
ncbi:hypothetical protein [Amycolatopsis viridis]|uniref:Uncharacterized protein n=1 Tax=Amycolatopsis viridis TaxID=185678 RepID=A0ABX0SVC2_9PSEU|nr:hypothetical protein [Amycolatopsis viridis]NIH80473.1 hypothetical protein [Amycolatopsis viridis]